MPNNYGPRIVTDGLVLCLDAGNTKSYTGSGTTWTDLSRNGNNGTLTNGPTFNSANGGSIVFDGSNDYVLNPDIARNQSDQTYSCWFILTSNISSDVTLLCETTSSSLNYTRIGMFISNTYNLKFGGRGISNEPTGNIYQKISTATISQNIWYNFVGVWNVASATIKIYLNGLEISGNFSGTGSVQSHADVASFSGFRIGSSFNFEYFPGRIAQTFVHNKVLSAAEILQNYNATKGRFKL